MNFTEKMELKDRKIEKLRKRIADLQAENEKLKGDLELERKDKDEGYQQAKNMIIELGEMQKIYQRLIDQAKIAKNAYTEECAKLKEFRKRASKKNKETIKEIKKKGGM